jgi:hypothetical protein
LVGAVLCPVLSAFAVFALTEGAEAMGRLIVVVMPVERPRAWEARARAKVKMFVSVWRAFE